MPNIQIINVSGGNVTLTQGGVSMTCLPAGFVGELPLMGTYSVALAGIASTVPELNYATAWPSSAEFIDVGGWMGKFYATTNHDPIVDMFQLTAGTPLFYMRWNNDIYYPAGTVPKGVANYKLTASQGELGAIVFSDAGSTFKDAMSTNMVSTNTGSVQLGSFVAEVGLKSIIIHPKSLSSQDYGVEFQAVSLGMVAGLTVLLFAFILRLVRAIPSQGGDF